MAHYLLIFTGFVLLIFGSNRLVDVSGRIARCFCVSCPMIILAVVAFGISAHELVISLFAAINPKNTDIALTNVIGSNIFNTFAIGAPLMLFV